jgi:adenosylcobinamide kinase/adenosylcobinamide-phosphate guanylyltransferase
MGELVLVTGGARSGKSRFAEQLVGDGGCCVTYIATAIAFDDEMKHRVRMHRERRPQDWKTLELPYGISGGCDEISGGPCDILIDCVTIMVTNIMLREPVDWENAPPADISLVERAVLKEVDIIINLSKELNGKVITVSNETGMGIVPPNALGRAFRDIAGRVNQRIAQNAGAVYFCVSGIPVRIK